MNIDRSQELLELREELCALTASGETLDIPDDVIIKGDTFDITNLVLMDQELEKEIERIATGFCTVKGSKIIMINDTLAIITEKHHEP